MKVLIKKFFDLIFENSCLICNVSSSNEAVCIECESSFKERKENYIKHLEEITVYIYGYYEDRLRNGILSFKNGKKELAPYFASLLSKFWNKVTPASNFKDCLIIPIPCHKARIHERGYCHTSLLGRKFASYSSQDYSNTLIIRKKNTKHMNSLNNAYERKENVSGAFKIDIKTLHKILPKHKKLLLIDDIVTTGSTMSEAAKTIKMHAPNISIVGLTIASGDNW